MTLLPDSPRRRWRPSQWNIVRASAAIGAVLALGACADDITQVEDDGTSDGPLTNDDNTSYSDSITSYTTYTDDWNDDYCDDCDYTDYGEHDWSDDYTDWDPECYVDEDCGPGMECVYDYCQPLSQCGSSSDCEFDQFCNDASQCVGVDLTAQCPGPAFQEIPLPPEAGGVVVALSFVDVDGDQDQELVLVRADAIVIIDEGVPMTIPHAGLAIDGIAVTDVDEDGLLDLVATSRTKLNARVLFADGLGGFADSGVGPMMRLDDAYGIDWPAGGAGELLARNQANEAVMLSNLAQLMPQFEALDLGVVEALGAADFDDDGLTDIVALQACQPLFSLQNGDLTSLEAFGPPGSCAMGIGDVDGDPFPDLAIVRADPSISVVTIYSSNFIEVPPLGLFGSYSAIQPTTYGGLPVSLLAQSGGDLDYIWANDDLSWCRKLMPAPPILRFVVGDSDGDGDDEIATLDLAGTVQLWGDG